MKHRTKTSKIKKSKDQKLAKSKGFNSRDLDSPSEKYNEIKVKPESSSGKKLVI